ncbi:hypothetical protein MIDIC_230073 [Alphaproteobacteria bacterium]
MQQKEYRQQEATANVIGMIGRQGGSPVIARVQYLGSEYFVSVEMNAPQSVLTGYAATLGVKQYQVAEMHMQQGNQYQFKNVDTAITNLLEQNYKNLVIPLISSDDRGGGGHTVYVVALLKDNTYDLRIVTQTRNITEDSKQALVKALQHVKDTLQQKSGKNVNDVNDVKDVHIVNGAFCAGNDITSCTEAGVPLLEAMVAKKSYAEFSTLLQDAGNSLLSVPELARIRLVGTLGDGQNVQNAVKEALVLAKAMDGNLKKDLLSLDDLWGCNANLQFCKEINQDAKDILKNIIVTPSGDITQCMQQLQEKLVEQPMQQKKQDNIILEQFTQNLFESEILDPAQQQEKQQNQQNIIQHEVQQEIVIEKNEQSVEELARALTRDYHDKCVAAIGSDDKQDLVAMRECIFLKHKLMFDGEVVKNQGLRIEGFHQKLMLNFPASNSYTTSLTTDNIGKRLHNDPQAVTAEFRNILSNMSLQEQEQCKKQKKELDNLDPRTIDEICGVMYTLKKDHLNLEFSNLQECVNLFNGLCNEKMKEQDKPKSQVEKLKKQEEQKKEQKKECLIF